MMNDPAAFTSHSRQSGIPLEIHMLTSCKDAELAAWALLSWYAIGKRNDALCIHDDGSLRPSDEARFHRMLPSCRIIRRSHADTVANKLLRPFPALQEFRKSNNLALKVLDFFFFARTRKFILLDSDVFTFDRLDFMDDCAYWPWNSFLRDYHCAFNLERHWFERFNAISTYRPINSGFGVVDIDTLDLGLANDVIHQTNYEFRPYWAEQTLFAILSSPFGVQLFDRSCVVAQGPGLTGIRVKHYVWKTRHFARSEAIPFIQQTLDESFVA
jgi:hypothetical protein